MLLVKFNAKFAGYKPEQLNALYEQMVDRFEALPGVKEASVSGQPALIGGNWNSPIRVRGHDNGPNVDTGTSLNRVGPGFFETMAIPVVQGRAMSSNG